MPTLRLSEQVIIERDEEVQSYSVTCPKLDFTLSFS